MSDTTSIEHNPAQSESPTGIARCAPLDSESAPYTVHGVAIGADEITLGQNGAKFWPTEELRQAAQSLIGVPLNKNHDDKHVESVIGEVVNADFVEDVGIVFEAEVDEESIATKIARGRLEVSVHALHVNGGETDEGAMLVENIRFVDLSVVPRGASPSNYVEAGESSSEALASLSADDVAQMLDTNTEALQDDDARSEQSTDDAVIDNAGVETHQATLANHHDFDVGDFVQGESSGGTWYGVVTDYKLEGCYDGEIDGDFKICANDEDPVYLIDDVSEETGERSDTTKAHLEESVNPWSGPKSAEDSIMTNEDTELTDEATTDEAEASEDVAPDEGPDVSEEAELEDDDVVEAEASEETDAAEEAELAEVRAELDELRAENAELNQELESVRMEYAERLADDGPFTAEELSAKFTFDELQEKFQEAEESLVGAEADETSAPDPQTGEVESEESLSTSTESNSAEIAKLEEKVATYDEIGWEAARDDAEARLAELRE